MENLNYSVIWAIVFSGVFLWVGMLTGVWKYYQIRCSAQSRAHYYVDIAHRSSLLYAPASLILAVLAYFSVWIEEINLIFVLINLFFFSFSILSYILHGWLKDTTNQFKQPHQMGRWHLPKWVLSSAMLLLVIGELVATAGLLGGAVIGLFKL
ncbi:hypothetical protein H0S58_06700 [Acinetobacter sp. TTH0-4]|uniref:hypothetical protein n=1 Tax=Acinetobacter sp. TTH0-4 TaxID=1646498 RepID=UPI00189C79BB|nr:hypothetical protein [Acinetobacter sp. TTH0-4]QPF39155.1 hypothetical protein H0S58_06700 [Acinetobacter sp. TTH0-4]